MLRRKALLVGVPEYDSEAIADLPVVRNDLDLMRGALEASGYNVDSVGIDAKSLPTRGKILQVIRRYCHSARAKDTLVLYFSGHGIHYDGRDFLVPFDGSVEDRTFEDYLVPVDFVEAFDASKATTILFFVDACREGIELGSKSLSLKPWGGWQTA